jgi:hypothetical protein
MLYGVFGCSNITERWVAPEDAKWLQANPRKGPTSGTEIAVELDEGR